MRYTYFCIILCIILNIFVIERAQCQTIEIQNANKDDKQEDNLISIYTDPTDTKDKKFFADIFPKMVSEFGPELQYKFYFIDDFYSSVKRMCAFEQWNNDLEKQLEYFACELSGTRIIDCINVISWSEVDAIMCVTSKANSYRNTAVNYYNHLNTTVTPIITIGNRMLTQIFLDNVFSFLCSHFPSFYPDTCNKQHRTRGRLFKPLNPKIKLKSRSTRTRNLPKAKVVNIFSNFSKEEDKFFFANDFPRIVQHFGRAVRFDYYFMDNFNDSSRRMCALEQWKTDYDKLVSYFKCEAKNMSMTDCIDIVGQNDVDNVICAATIMESYTNTSIKYYSYLKTNVTPLITIKKNVLETPTYYGARAFICTLFNGTFSKFVCPPVPDPTRTTSTSTKVNLTVDVDD